MHVIHAVNVNDAFRKGLALIMSAGEESPSRNGPVLRVDMPVTTVYSRPQERVLFDSNRHANPFFHLFEALWMLNGGQDVGTMEWFIKTFRQFSDNGVTFHGAYGHRWRHWPVYSTTYMQELDQLKVAIAMLKADPTSRRVVIGMWDPARDLAKDSKDIPCNDLIKLSISDHKFLNMIVFNRSNDVVWGCYGANAVHMSILHEYLASMIGVLQGTLTQISCDFHAYLETPYNVQSYLPKVDDTVWQNPYDEGVASYRLVTNPDTFDDDLAILMRAISVDHSVRSINRNALTNFFFADIAIPMHLAWEHIRAGEHGDARKLLTSENAKFFNTQNDWIEAGIDWIDETARRKK